MARKSSLNTEINLMVALDLTEMDPILLRYVSYLNSIWKIKNLYFTHNIKQSQLYNLYEEFLEDNISVDEIVERELKRSISENYRGSTPHKLLITSDNYTEGILTHLAKEYDIHVMITGKKDALQGTGALSQKLVRMLPCHLLLIPEETKDSLKNVLVPTDFSADSAQSIIIAANLVRSSNGRIEAFHVYDIPSFFFPYIDTDKAHDKTKQHLSNRFEQFNKKFELPESIHFKYGDKGESSVAETIEQEAEKGNFDMVVISARGANNLTSLFIGSITNDLLLRINNRPLLVIKRK